MQETYDRINNRCIVTLTFIAVTVALIYTKSILIPFVIALFIYSISSPAITWFQEKWKLPRVISVILTMAIFIIVFFITSLFVFKSLNAFFAGIDAYQARFTQTIEDSVALLNTWGVDLNAGKIRESINSLPIFSIFKKLTGGIVSFLSNASLIVIMVLFMISGKVTTEKNENKTISQIQKKISKYITIKFGISLLTAILIGILFFSLKVELAFMFAVLTFMLNFIPSVGSFIAILLPIPVLILQFGFSVPMFTILGISIIIQFSIGNVIEPKLMGENLGLHPITILLFLLFWGLVWGIPGMFLAVPITVIMNIVLKRIETTKKLSRLFEGHLD